MVGIATKGSVLKGGIALICSIPLLALYLHTQITKHPKFTSAKVLKVRKGYKGAQIDVCYEYYVYGKRYYFCQSAKLCTASSIKEADSLWSGRIFPLVYAANWPSQNYLLLTKGLAAKYHYRSEEGLPPYDSLLPCE